MDAAQAKARHPTSANLAGQRVFRPGDSSEEPLDLLDRHRDRGSGSRPLLGRFLRTSSAALVIELEGEVVEGEVVEVGAFAPGDIGLEV